MAGAASLGLTLPSRRGVLNFFLQDGHDQVVLRHQIVLHYEACKPVTQEGFILILVKYLAMVEVGVGEYPINATTNRA